MTHATSTALREIGKNLANISYDARTAPADIYALCRVLHAHAEAVERMEHDLATWRSAIGAALQSGEAHAVTLAALRLLYAQEQPRPVDPANAIRETRNDE